MNLNERSIPMAHNVIVVGIDGSEASKAALRWAVEEARLRHARVQAVHAWWIVPMLKPGGHLAPAASDWGAEDATECVRTFVTETVGEQTEVEITPVAVQGEQASVALVDAAKGADLLVVGSRGAGGFSGLLLGSISQQCAHHAPCPIVIVREN
jgi:nucleotide-binding universal stress UspA family protein